MPRKATGSVYESRGVWYAAITYDKKKRDSFALPVCKSDPAARERAEVMNGIAQRLRAAGQAHAAPRFLKEAGKRQPGKELDLLLRAVEAVCRGAAVPKDVVSPDSTIEGVGKLWTNGKLAQQFRDHVKPREGSDEIDALLCKHVYPHVGHVEVRKFTDDHGQMVLDALPPKMEQSSRRNIAKLLNRILNLSVFPLKLIGHNPLPRGWLPKPGVSKARSCIYPSEDVQLMGCAKVPLGVRLLWGYLHREGHRKDEALHLVWNDFDLIRGTINLDKNKTRDARFWKLAPGVARALRAWKAYREEREGKLDGTALVFFAAGGRTLDDDRVFHAARVYRANLELAGIDRAQLHTRNANRRPVRAHDTRAAFVTVSLANGKNEVWIYDRTGHTTLSEMKNYRRAARTIEELDALDRNWQPLDKLIPELLPYMPTEEAMPTESVPRAAAPTAPQEAAAAAAPTAPQEAAPEVCAPAEVCTEEDAGGDADGVGCLTEPGCAAEESGLGAGHEGNVGAIVGAQGMSPLGWGFVSVTVSHDLPLMIGPLSMPTFPAACTSSGTAP